MYPVGTNVLNERTIAESARGLADYVTSRKGEGSPRSCVIAHDTRHHSAEFARLCARVLAAAGFKVFLFKEPRSTPLLSFSVRHLHCDAGIMVTASHNPPSDNGFKCYGRSGGQVIPPDDAGIIACVAAASDREIPEKPFAEALADGSIRVGRRRRRSRLYHRGRERVGLPCSRHLHRLHAPARRGRDVGRQGARDRGLSPGPHPRLPAHARRRFSQRAGPRRQPRVSPNARSGDRRGQDARGRPGHRQRSRRRSHRRRGSRLSRPSRRLDHARRQPDRRHAGGLRDQGIRSARAGSGPTIIWSRPWSRPR